MTRLALCDAAGPLKDLLDKLQGEEGSEWLGKLKELLRKGRLEDRLLRLGYFSPENIETLKSDSSLHCLLRDVFSGTVKMVEKHIIDCNKNPRYNADLDSISSIHEHRLGESFEWDPGRIDLYLSNEQKNSSEIKGHELQKYLVNLPILNANVLDYLTDHPELIPEHWKGKVVLFFGTIYMSTTKNQYQFIRGIEFREKKWEENRYYLGTCFLRTYFVAMLKKK